MLAKGGSSNFVTASLWCSSFSIDVQALHQLRMHVCMHEDLLADAE